MITEAYNGNSPLAEELIAKWNEKNVEVERLTREMKEMTLKMKTEFSRFQNGDVIRNTEDGKKYVVVTSKVYESSLCHTKPSIEFKYEVKPIRKSDGMPSANFSHEYFNCGSDFEPTGEHFNFTTQQYD